MIFIKYLSKQGVWKKCQQPKQWTSIKEIPQSYDILHCLIAPNMGGISFSPLEWKLGSLVYTSQQDGAIRQSSQVEQEISTISRTQCLHEVWVPNILWTSFSKMVLNSLLKKKMQKQRPPRHPSKSSYFCKSVFHCTPPIAAAGKHCSKSDNCWATLELPVTSSCFLLVCLEPPWSLILGFGEVFHPKDDWSRRPKTKVS